MSVPRVVLQPRRARPFYGRHPWVYPGGITRIEGDPQDGAVVELVSHAEQFIARGLYNSRSKIRVRLYSWLPEERLDRAFWRARLQDAIQLRRDVLGLLTPGSACRLVFSEGDGLSGLTVDRYDDWLVVQFTSLGLAQRRQEIVELLVELLQPRGIVLRTERGIGALEGLDLQDGLLWGEIPIQPIVIAENGLKYQVHLTEGQKTGFYLDQRANRIRVAAYAAGRRMLDAFCYSGGFGLCASRAGARSVIGVDVSEPAIRLAEANVACNALRNITFTVAEVFENLEQRIAAGERYDLIVLDPPKFARQRDAVEEALRGYRRLHTLALRLLDANGILATCCCSGHIDMPMLEQQLALLAEQEKRTIQILERAGQAADHPVLATCPESNYLKCIICRAV